MIDSRVSGLDEASLPNVSYLCNKHSLQQCCSGEHEWGVATQTRLSVGLVWMEAAPGAGGEQVVGDALQEGPFLCWFQSPFHTESTPPGKGNGETPVCLLDVRLGLYMEEDGAWV